MPLLFYIQVLAAGLQSICTMYVDKSTVHLSCVFIGEGLHVQGRYPVCHVHAGAYYRMAVCSVDGGMVDVRVLPQKVCAAVSHGRYA